MTSENLELWEQVEAERSAYEASLVDNSQLVASKSRVDRYLDPPLDTWHELEYCYALLGDAKGKTVLEYGCGDGNNTLLLALRGAKVKALDISPDLIEIAKKRLEVNQVEGDVEFILGSAHDIPFPDESVDIVFGMAILHHLNLELSAKEVKRVLKKGGKVFAGFGPLYNSFNGDHGMAVSWATKNGNTKTSTVKYGVTPEALTMNATGIEVTYYGNEYHHHVELHDENQGQSRA